MFLVVPYGIHALITSQMFSACIQQLHCKKFEPHPAMFSRCFQQFPGPLAPSGKVVWSSKQAFTSKKDHMSQPFRPRHIRPWETCPWRVTANAWGWHHTWTHWGGRWRRWCWTDARAGWSLVHWGCSQEMEGFVRCCKLLRSCSPGSLCSAARETVTKASPCSRSLFQELHAQGCNGFQHHDKVCLLMNETPPTDTKIR